MADDEWRRRQHAVAGGAQHEAIRQGVVAHERSDRIGLLETGAGLLVGGELHATHEADALGLADEIMLGECAPLLCKIWADIVAYAFDQLFLLQDTQVL